MTKKFYKEWRKVTDLEKKAIKVLEEGKRIVLKTLPKEEIISIYIKGSMPRRELTEKSDVDIVVILKTIKYLPKLKKLHKQYENKYHPKLELKGYSIWELKTGKRIKISSSSVRPARFSVHLKQGRHRLLYGKDLASEKFFMGDKIKFLKGMIGAFRNIFLPTYYDKDNKKIGFRGLIKQTFWLTEYELYLKGIEPPHTWKDLPKLVKDKNHIVHDAIKYRENHTKDPKLRKAYIKKLEKHLKKLDRLVEKSSKST